VQSIGAAAAEAPPHVVDGTLVPLLKELYKDSYADIRGVALGQTTTTGEGGEGIRGLGEGTRDTPVLLNKKHPPPPLLSS
jgi:hypothetical protein